MESNPSNPVTSNQIWILQRTNLLPYCAFDHFDLLSTCTEAGEIEQFFCSYFCFHLGPFLGFLHLGWQVGDGMWDRLRSQQGSPAPDHLTAETQPPETILRRPPPDPQSFSSLCTDGEVVSKQGCPCELCLGIISVPCRNVEMAARWDVMREALTTRG